MTLYSQLTNDLKDAMRSGDVVRRECVRGVITMLKNEAIDKRIDIAAMDDALAIAVLKRAKKQREDAYAQYMTGGRPELAEKEKAEAALISVYLPAQMDEEAVVAIVDAVIASGVTQFGAVMSQVMARVQGGADGSVVKRLVEERLKA